MIGLKFDWAVVDWWRFDDDRVEIIVDAFRRRSAGPSPEAIANRGHPRVAWRTGKAAWARGASSRCQGCVVSAEPGAPRRFGSGARRVGGQVAGSPVYGAAVGKVQGQRGGR